MLRRHVSSWGARLIASVGTKPLRPRSSPRVANAHVGLQLVATFLRSRTKMLLDAFKWGFRLSMRRFSLQSQKTRISQGPRLRI